MAAIAITTRAAAEERPTEWEAFGGAPFRAARNAAVKLRRRRRKIAHRGFEGRLARVLSGRQPLHGLVAQRVGAGEKRRRL